jgi:hypothetical protein
MDTVTETVPVRLVDSRAIESAMIEIGARMAAELDLFSNPLEGDEPILTALDTVAALLQPVSMASAYYDLCTALGIQPPHEVLEAVGKRPYRRVFVAPPY